MSHEGRGADMMSRSQRAGAEYIRRGIASMNNGIMGTDANAAKAKPKAHIGTLGLTTGLPSATIEDGRYKDSTFPEVEEQ